VGYIFRISLVRIVFIYSSLTETTCDLPDLHDLTKAILSWHNPKFNITEHELKETCSHSLPPS
jgi:hypothetical protein